MKTLIVYATANGDMERCVNSLMRHLGNTTDTIKLKNEKSLNLEGYDAVILGASTQGRRTLYDLRGFCFHNIQVLKQKHIGLFIHSLESGDAAEREFVEAFPAELICHADANAIFGSEIDWVKINWMTHTLSTKVDGALQPLTVEGPAIEKFV